MAWGLCEVSGGASYVSLIFFLDIRGDAPVALRALYNAPWVFIDISMHIAVFFLDMDEVTHGGVIR